jgi:hypothetical protein
MNAGLACPQLNFAVGIAARLRVGRPGGSNPDGRKRYFFLPIVQTRSGAHPASYSMSTGVIARADKAAWA